MADAGSARLLVDTVTPGHMIPPMADNAVEVRDLTKAFRDVVAVAGISFEVKRGEVFSLLGPNGAGKSTAISIISGLLRPDSGDALVMGHSILKESMAARRSLGVVPQEIALYSDMSARENLVFWGRMYGLSGGELSRRVDEMLSAVGLVERQKGRVGTFSGGMKRRVNIAAALLHRPAVVVMDEPTVGIDPQSRRHILDHVKELNRQGMSVFTQRTTWRKRKSCRTASPSWTRARSSPPARATSWCAW